MSDSDKKEEDVFEKAKALGIEKETDDVLDSDKKLILENELAMAKAQVFRYKTTCRAMVEAEDKQGLARALPTLEKLLKGVDFYKKELTELNGSKSCDTM